MALEATVLPELTPVLVATRKDVDAVVKEGRAEVARLTLELRSTLHEVAELERLVDEPGPPGAPELVLAAVEAQKTAQRQTFAEAVERVTVEATATVAAARAEADALIAAASQASTDVLRRTIQSALAPSVRMHGADLANAVTAQVPIIAPAPSLQAPPAAPPPSAVPAFATAPPEVPAATAPDVPSPNSGRGFRSFLYADVLIPVIGAVIILIILLAWIG